MAYLTKCTDEELEELDNYRKKMNSSNNKIIKWYYNRKINRRIKFIEMSVDYEKNQLD